MSNSPSSSPAPSASGKGEVRPQPNDPLHGITLKVIVTELHEEIGWQALAELIPIRCFENNPSIKSSLTFLCKTPWARAKVEQLYLSRRG